MSMIRNTLTILGAFAVLSGAFALGVRYERKALVCPTQGQSKADTLIIHDTITIDRPIEKKRTILDTIYIKVPVTEYVRDTIQVALPRESVVYGGEDYKARISGVQPTLDWIEVYPKTKIITKTIQPSRWSLGIQAGYGVNKSGLTPYIGIGIQYNIWSF